VPNCPPVAAVEEAPVTHPLTVALLLASHIAPIEAAKQTSTSGINRMSGHPALEGPGAAVDQLHGSQGDHEGNQRHTQNSKTMSMHGV
jgi:hypothetical protein